MNMPRTVITAELLNPARASFADTSPVKVKTESTKIAVTSTGIQPPTNNARATMMIKLKIRRGDTEVNSYARDREIGRGS